VATIQTQIRIEEDVKKQAMELFSQLGIDMSSAVNMFLRQAIMRGGLPFNVEIPNYNIPIPSVPENSPADGMQLQFPFGESSAQPPSTEMERLKRGEMFWNSDPEINAVKKRARALAGQFNATTEEEPKRRLELLKELFGDCTEDIFIKPPFHCDYGFNIHVGKNFFANFQCVMLDAAPITIGDNCLMGPQTCLYTVNHPMDAATRIANYVYGKPITIGNNVWFGGNCVVLSGVTIGDNAVIGAGSVVTSDIPANAVAAGNPARILRYIDNSTDSL
jgi:maltose O-acetyltransferase